MSHGGDVVQRGHSISMVHQVRGVVPHGGDVVHREDSISMVHQVRGVGVTWG